MQRSCAGPGGSGLPAEYAEMRWWKPMSAVQESLRAVVGYTRSTQRPLDVPVCT